MNERSNPSGVHSHQDRCVPLRVSNLDPIDTLLIPYLWPYPKNDTLFKVKTKTKARFRLRTFHEPNLIH